MHPVPGHLAISTSAVKFFYFILAFRHLRVKKYKKRSGYNPYKPPPAAGEMGLNRRDYFFLNFFVDRILTASYYSNWMSRMLVLGNR